MTAPGRRQLCRVYIYNYHLGYQLPDQSNHTHTLIPGTYVLGVIKCLFIIIDSVLLMLQGAGVWDSRVCMESGHCGHYGQC